MKEINVAGQKRADLGKKASKQLRKQGIVPCNLYGLGLENVLFTVDAKELKTVTDTPCSYIVDLNLDGTKYTAVLHELQFHPVTDECLHVDFLAVNEQKPIAINVPIKITGHSKGVQLGGKFVQNSRSLRISALMANLPDDVTVDVSPLGIGESIKAGDLSFANLQILSDKNMIICTVRATRNSSAA